MLQRCRSFRGQLFRRLDTGRLDLDRDRPLRQGAEARRDLDDQVDPDVAGHGVADRALDLRGSARRLLDLPTHDGARRAAADYGADDDQEVGPQVLEPLRDGDRPVMDLLDEHVRSEVFGGKSFDRAPAQVKISLVQLADSADQDAHRRSGRKPSTVTATSRRTAASDGRLPAAARAWRQ